VERQYGQQMIIDSPVVSASSYALEQAEHWDEILWLSGCMAGIDKMAVRADGTVVGCPQLKRTFGNLRSNPLEGIWRELHTSRLEQLGWGCHLAEFRGFCGGGCPAPQAIAGELVQCHGRSADFPESQTAANANWCPQECPLPSPPPCFCPRDCPLPCFRPRDCPLPCSSPCVRPCSHPCPLPPACSEPCFHPCPIPHR
jgi:radical SAM protein with 4Fe4S-binding SPASM domain